MELPSCRPPEPACVVSAKRLAKACGPCPARPSTAIPLRNSLRCTVISSTSGLCSEQIFVTTLFNFAGAYGNTYRPWFFHAHQRERATQQRQILAEVDHLSHTLVRIFNAPEVVHDGRNSGKESGNRRSPDFWFDTQ